MVPLRIIAELLGAEVKWIPSEQQVQIIQRERSAVLTIGSNTVLVNGAPLELQCAPCIIAPGKTFIPEEFISKILDVSYTKDKDRKTVHITNKGRILF